jgi:hypothetical protein
VSLDDCHSLIFIIQHTYHTGLWSKESERVVKGAVWEGKRRTLGTCVSTGSDGTVTLLLEPLPKDLANSLFSVYPDIGYLTGLADPSGTLRPSGEFQDQRQPVLDLPPQRSLTPINLGFSMPSTPVENRHESQIGQRQAAGGYSAPIQSTRPDPRRPVPKQAREANENAHPTRDPSQSSTGSSISKLDKIDKTSSEWEVLSDADSRLNEGEVVDVEELQKKVDKR